MALPPVFAASALYDSLLQAALRQFFRRATFETEPIPSLSSDGRLAIEPTNDPSVLSIRWFGSRHVLHVPATPAVHATRSAARAGDRRRAGAALSRDLRPDGRCSSAAICFAARSKTATSARSSTRGESGPKPDRRAAIWSRRRSRCCAWRRCRATRTGAISSGVLLLDAEGTSRARRHRARSDQPYRYSQALTGIKSFYRLCDGLRRCSSSTARARCSISSTSRTCVAATAVSVWTCRARAPIARTRWRPRAIEDLASCSARRTRSKCSPQGVQIFSFRNARWHLLDMQAKYDMWEAAVGHEALADRLFQTAIDLADARQGALFVVLRDPAASLPRAGVARRPARRASRHAGRSPDAWPADVHAPRSDRDRLDRDGPVGPRAHGRCDGHGLARAACSRSAPSCCTPSRRAALDPGRRRGPDDGRDGGRPHGAVLKVSEDGLITFYEQQEQIWDI